MAEFSQMLLHGNEVGNKEMPKNSERKTSPHPPYPGLLYFLREAYDWTFILVSNLFYADDHFDYR